VAPRAASRATSASCCSVGWAKWRPAIAQSGGCEVDYQYFRRYPPLVNSVEQTTLAVEAAALTVGRENVEPNTPPITGAEDFAFMLEKKPGAYIIDRQWRRRRRRLPSRAFRRSTISTTRILTTGAAYWVNLVQLELGDAV